MKGQLKGPGVRYTNNDQDLGQKSNMFQLELDFNEIFIKVGALYLKKMHKRE